MNKKNKIRSKIFVLCLVMLVTTFIVYAFSFTNILKISGKTTGSSTQTCKSLRIGGIMTVDSKNITLLNVGSNGAVQLDVSGISETIYNGTIKMIGIIQVNIPYIYYTDQPAEREATICTKLIRIKCNPKQIIGDVDGNNKVTNEDANLTLKIAVGLIPMPSNLCCIDLNKDKKVSSADAVKIFRIAGGLEKSPGICPIGWFRNLFR